MQNYRTDTSTGNKVFSKNTESNKKKKNWEKTKSNFAPEHDKKVDIQNTFYILHLREKCVSHFKQDLLNLSG